MKFNLSLDESLFDDELDSFITKDMPASDFEFDDDFSEYDEHNPENVLPGPQDGTATGVATEIIALINDEWEAIQGYNNAISTLRSVSIENPFYANAIRVLEEISSEENTHVGQLQEVLRHISPNAQEINNGRVEAKSQLGLVDGKLPVQSWESATRETTSTPENSQYEETCTLCDVDDEM